MHTLYSDRCAGCDKPIDQWSPVGTLCMACERIAAQSRVIVKRERRKEVLRILNTLSPDDLAKFNALAEWNLIK